MNTCYAKTREGLAQLAGLSEGLSPRHRHVLLLCNGKRSLVVLRELLGPEVDADISALRRRGWVRPVGSAMLVPIVGGGGKQGGVSTVVRLGAGASVASSKRETPEEARHRMHAARDFVTLVVRSLEELEARELREAYEGATSDNDILVYAAALIDILFRGGDIYRAERVGYKIADLLPRNAVPRLIDCMLDWPDPRLAAALYEHLLSDRDVPSESGFSDLEKGRASS